ncbi:MAG: NAD(P)H-dependent oxidoreductase [Bacteroidia bacterium]|nr:NAD(P)H-dependent oxidoreductase [Bacteroidia bacterium]NNJ56669.1 NAD(P)H-dependent oxidoreductase [Bacteroidia bacterium]
MKKKILAFGASNSSTSINRQLASFAANQIQDAEVTLLDLNDYEMPIYGIDKEKATGIPEKAIAFKQLIKDSDALVISFAEHNGAYSAAFKNILDWISRIEKDVWANNPMLLLATSPGARGGSTVLEIATNKFKFMNQNSIETFSLPSFNDNFKENTITDDSLATQFNQVLQTFQEAI